MVGAASQRVGAVQVVGGAPRKSEPPRGSARPASRQLMPSEAGAPSPRDPPALGPAMSNRSRPPPPSMELHAARPSGECVDSSLGRPSEVGPKLVDSGQVWSIFADFRPNFVDTGPTLVEVGRDRHQVSGNAQPGYAMSSPGSFIVVSEARGVPQTGRTPPRPALRSHDEAVRQGAGGARRRAPRRPLRLAAVEHCRPASAGGGGAMLGRRPGRHRGAGRRAGHGPGGGRPEAARRGEPAGGSLSVRGSAGRRALAARTMRVDGSGRGSRKAL